MVKKIEELIKKSNSIAIFFHINPDGDAVGSSLALKLALEQMGKSVKVFSQDVIPDRLHFLDYKSVSLKNTNEKFDLAFVLDCPEIRRIGTMFSVYKNCKTVVNIDHHLFNQNFTEFKIVDTQVSSTCEIVYNFIKELNLTLTKDICLCLYTGMATDSGCFMYNISPSLHKIVGSLSKEIDDLENVNYILFRQKSKAELSLYGNCLTNLEYPIGNNLAITAITKKDLIKYKAKEDDSVGLIFLLSGLVDVKVICVICEEKFNQFKVAFRSKSTDVCALAKIFGGGGHKFASGCKIFGTKNYVKNLIIEKTREYLCTE